VDVIIRIHNGERSHAGARNSSDSTASVTTRQSAEMRRARDCSARLDFLRGMAAVDKCSASGVKRS